MPKQNTFRSEADGRNYSVDEDGDLIAHQSYDGTSTIVSAAELEEFVAWLTDEADRIRTAKREAGEVTPRK
jgi:uncharacterized small protein (DUF1192 family)